MFRPVGSAVSGSGVGSAVSGSGDRFRVSGSAFFRFRLVAEISVCGSSNTGNPLTGPAIWESVTIAGITAEGSAILDFHGGGHFRFRFHMRFRDEHVRFRSRPYQRRCRTSRKNLEKTRGCHPHEPSAARRMGTREFRSGLSVLSEGISGRFRVGHPGNFRGNGKVRPAMRARHDNSQSFHHQPPVAVRATHFKGHHRLPTVEISASLVIVDWMFWICPTPKRPRQFIVDVSGRGRKAAGSLMADHRQNRHIAAAGDFAGIGFAGFASRVGPGIRSAQFPRSLTPAAGRLPPSATCD